MTNDDHGVVIGYSPDGLVGDDGLIECKSRRQKYQIETILPTKCLRVPAAVPDWIARHRAEMAGFHQLLRRAAGVRQARLAVPGNSSGHHGAASAFEQRLAAAQADTTNGETASRSSSTPSGQLNKRSRYERHRHIENHRSKSEQLNADDLIAGPRTITVTSVKLVAEDQPVAIHFAGDEGKPTNHASPCAECVCPRMGRRRAQYVGKSDFVPR